LRRVIPDKVNEMKLSKQFIGKHTNGSYPRLIATELSLENLEQYTSHCFRRSAATIFANSGCSLMQLKMTGGWKSDTIAQSYLAQSSLQQQICAASFRSREVEAIPTPRINN
jgi:hypothetical protein